MGYGIESFTFPLAAISDIPDISEVLCGLFMEEDRKKFDIPNQFFFFQNNHPEISTFRYNHSYT